MLTLLKRLQITHLLAIVSLVPLVIVLVFSILIQSKIHTEKRNANYSDDAVMLTALLDNIAHQHAVERGAVS
jgi:hypothetical protein